MSINTLRIYQTTQGVTFTDRNNLLLHQEKYARGLVGMDDTKKVPTHFPRTDRLLHAKTFVWDAPLEGEESLPAAKNCPCILNAYEVDLQTGEIVEDSVTHHDPRLFNEHLSDGKQRIETLVAECKKNQDAEVHIPHH